MRAGVADWAGGVSWPAIAAQVRLDQPFALDLDRAAPFALAQLAAGQDEAEREQHRARARARMLASLAVRDYRQGYALTPEAVAVIPVYGSLGPAKYWAWTSYEQIEGAARAAFADPDVASVLLLIDSPGGYVAGCADCASALRAAADAAGKPFAAHADELAASAAYWLAASADRITTPATGLAGSIGALMVHTQFAGLLEKWGVASSVVRSAPRKAEANSIEPLSDVARAQLQHEVDLAAGLFVAHVAARRGLEPQAVEALQAACFAADQALSHGLIDATASTREAVAALVQAAKPKPKPQSQSASKAQSRPAPLRPTTAPPAASAPPVTSRGGPLSRVPAKGANPKGATTMLTPAQKAERRNRVAEITAQEAADEAAQAAQFDEIEKIVNEAAEGEQQPESPPADAAAARLQAERDEDARALALPEARGRVEAVMSMRKAGMRADAIQGVLKVTPATSAFASARAAAAGEHLSPGAGPELGPADRGKALIAAAKSHKV